MPATRKDYYRELGLQPDATQGQVREAYRRLAKKYHPDTNRGDPKAEEKFKRISEAYQVLSDPEQRLIYQQNEALRAKVRTASKGKPAAPFSDLFKKVFKAGFGVGIGVEEGAPPRAGRTLKITLDLDMVELAQGAKKTVLVNREAVCQVCGGRGLKPGHQPAQCNICLGIGEVPTSRGGKTVFVTCRNCNGTGQVIRDRCLNCGGTGIARGRSRITVQVPPGSKDGDTLTIKGQGDAGRGGAANGDLRIVLRLKEDAYLSAKGPDVVYECPLNLLEVMLGGEIEVPTPSGKVKLTLKPGLPPDSTLRVKGKGLPKGNGGRGDLLVRIKYHLPAKMGVKARRLLEELVELPGWSPKRDKSGFVKKR